MGKSSGRLVKWAAAGVASILAGCGTLGDTVVEFTATDPNGNAWKLAYDAMGRLSSRTDPLNQQASSAASRSMRFQKDGSTDHSFFGWRASPRA